MENSRVSTAPSVTWVKAVQKAHSDQDAENKDTCVSLMGMPITKQPIKAPCLKSGDLGYNISVTNEVTNSATSDTKEIE